MIIDHVNNLIKLLITMLRFTHFPWASQPREKFALVLEPNKKPIAIAIRFLNTTTRLLSFCHR